MPDGYLEAGFPKPGSLERAVREERSGMSSSDVAPDPRVVVVRMRIPHQIGQEETGTEPAPFWRTSYRRPQKGMFEIKEGMIEDDTQPSKANRGRRMPDCCDRGAWFGG